MLVGESWEKWQVKEMFFLGSNITRYTITRMRSFSEHDITFEEIQRLYKTKQIKL